MRLTLTLALFGVLVFGGSAQAETCGEMMAQKAVLPATMAEVMTSVADMLDAHAAFMSKNKTKEAKKEVSSLKKISKDHRDLAKKFEKTAANMEKLKTQPGADHDMEAMKADEKLQASMSAMLASQTKMIGLLKAEVAELQAQGVK